MADTEDMTITSVSATTAPVAISQPQTTASVARDRDGDGDGGGAKVSKLGDLMQQLQSLEARDPAKAKDVLTKISSALSAKADATGDNKLKHLADAFGKAAQTGDLSALQGHHHAGGHHHAHRGSDASKAQSYTQTDDPTQTVASVIESALS